MLPNVLALDCNLLPTWTNILILVPENKLITVMITRIMSSTYLTHNRLVNRHDKKNINSF